MSVFEPQHFRPKRGGVLHVMSSSHTAPLYPVGGCMEPDPRYAKRLADATCRRCLEARLHIAQRLLPHLASEQSEIDQINAMLALGRDDMELKDVNFRCRGCGKSVSYAQAIFYANGTYCLDSILELLRESETVDDGAMRVNVSADLLGRLRDGVI